MKKVKLILILILSDFCFCQLDTNSIFKEINSLENDSRVADYWQKLRNEDQKDHSNLTENAIRLFKSTYLIQQKGFPKVSDFGTLISRTPQLIFIHNMSVDINILTFSSLKPYKEMLSMKDSYPNYLMQNVLFWYYGIETKHIKLFENALQHLESKKIDFCELTKITNEIINFHNDLEVEKVEVYHTEIYGEKIAAEIISKKGKTYFVSGGNHQQVIIKNGNYTFLNNIDTTHFEFDEKKNLVLKSKKGVVLNTFIKN